MAAKILVIFNPKGGVGKSATTVNMAHNAVKAKLKTLVVDSDAQGNSTKTLVQNIPANALYASALFADSLPAGRVPVQVNEYLDVIPGDKKLKSIDGRVSSEDTPGMRMLYQTLRRNLREVAEGYDLVIIDTPTTAEHRYNAALVAADYCVTPAAMDAYSMQGARDLVSIVQNVKALYGNPKLKNLGILPNLFIKRSKLHNQTLETLRAAKLRIVSVTVPFRIAIQSALDEGKPSRDMRAACNVILKEVMQ